MQPPSPTFDRGNHPPLPPSASGMFPDALRPWESSNFHPIGSPAAVRADLTLPHLLASVFSLPLSCASHPFRSPPPPTPPMVGSHLPVLHRFACSRSRRFDRSGPPPLIQHIHLLTWILTSNCIPPSLLFRSQRRVDLTSNDPDWLVNRDANLSGISTPCFAPRPTFPRFLSSGDMSSATLPIGSWLTPVDQCAAIFGVGVLPRMDFCFPPPARIHRLSTDSSGTISHSVPSPAFFCPFSSDDASPSATSHTFHWLAAHACGLNGGDSRHCHSSPSRLTVSPYVIGHLVSTPRFYRLQTDKIETAAHQPANPSGSRCSPFRQL
jgi:hypothetical protein